MVTPTRIIVGGTRAKVRSPYEAKGIVKQFPGRKWHDSIKCWSVPTDMVNALADALRAAGHVVFVTNEDGTQYKAPKASDKSSSGQAHGHRGTPAAGWADAMFAAVGPERGEAAFKALSKALHPDVGGDTAVMQELNAARERAAFRRRSA